MKTTDLIEFRRKKSKLVKLAKALNKLPEGDAIRLMCSKEEYLNFKIIKNHGSLIAYSKREKSLELTRLKSELKIYQLNRGEINLNLEINSKAWQYFLYKDGKGLKNKGISATLTNIPDSTIIIY